MGTVEEWLVEQGKLTEYARGILQDLKEEAQFALYCQRGSGSCMADFGSKVARFARIFGVEPSQLLRRLLSEAVEATRDNNGIFERRRWLSYKRL